MQSALLWFKLFTSTLEGMGFKIKPYDLCVANNVINGTQFTICWYIDNLKLSHTNEEIVKEIISEIEERYGKMTVMYGIKHTYLGMDIFFPGNGEVMISMIECLKECIITLAEVCSAMATTPAGARIFNSNPEGTLLNEERQKTLHSIVAKPLFVSMRARPDI